MNISESNAILNQEESIDISSNHQVHIQKSVRTVGGKAFRRTVDIIASIVGMLVVIPLTAVIYISNKLSKQSGPVFYTEEKRIGLNGKPFKMYKYRTMVVGADEKLKEILAENEELREEYKKYKKLKKDPRITKIGNILRKTSLDEFPQFINILKGEMTLVGPRPYLEREKEEMGDAYNTIIKYKPGLTGKWQISGRSGITFQDRLNIDIDYCNNRSIKEDAKILIKTVAKTIIKEGAL